MSYAADPGGVFASDAHRRVMAHLPNPDDDPMPVADLIVEMDQKLGTTTVTITHDMKVAFKIADRVAMLCNGKIIEQGTPEEFQASQNPIVRQFVEGRAEGPLTEGF